MLRAMVGVPRCSKCFLGEGQVIKNDGGLRNEGLKHRSAMNSFGAK